MSLYTFSIIVSLRKQEKEKTTFPKKYKSNIRIKIINIK